MSRYYKYFIIFFLLVFLFLKFPDDLFAQNKKIVKDTTFVDSTKFHSPKVATIMSACLPGLGQIYNKKYWKVPLIYSGFGVIGYSIVVNSKKYKKFLTAYIDRVDDNPTTIDTIYPGYTLDEITLRKDYYRRNRDLSYIIGVVWYILNVFDATVDAHLFFFNINEDLSLNFKIETFPLYYKNATSSIQGLTVSLNIGKFNSNKYDKPKINL